MNTTYFPRKDALNDSLGFLLSWLFQFTEGDTQWKDLIDAKIIEVQKWLKKEANAYTVAKNDRTSYPVISFIHDLCSTDEPLAQWIKDFNPKTTTVEEYKIFYGSVKRYSELARV